MTDLTGLSDADLNALYAQSAGAPAGVGGMTDAQLQAAYQQAQAPTNPPIAGRIADVATGNPGTDIPRFVGTAAANAAAGVTSLPRTIAQGVDWLGNAAGFNIGADRALASIPSPGHPQYSLFPDYQTARDVFLTGTGATEYVPQSFGGRLGMNAATGALAGALSGSPEAIVPAAGAAAAGGVTSEMFPDHPVLGAIPGILAGGKLGQMAMNAPQRIGATLLGTGEATEPYGAFQRQGLPTNLVGTVTGEPGPGWAEKFAARMPGSEGPIAHARGDLVNAWQDRFDQIASRVGNASTAQEAGSSLQNAASNWVDQFKNQQAARWGLFDTLVPPTTQIGVSNFKSALNGVLQDFGGANNLAKVLQPQLAANLKSALGADLKGGSTLPWQAVQSVRTALGAMLENPQPIEGMGKSAIKRLYAGLSQDMESGANAAGPQAATAFRQASTLTSMGHDILDSYVTPILKSETPEKAAQWALGQARLGGSRVAGVTQHLPSASGDLAAYALRSAAGNADNPSPTALATALTGRKPVFSPEATQALFPAAQDQADIADMATTGKAMQPFEKDLANSPTSTHQIRGVGPLIMGLEMSKEGHELAGVPGRIAGFALGAMAPNILGRTAQATALNPYLSALYGRSIPMKAAAPSMLSRALIAPALTPRLPAGTSPGATFPVAPATSASLPTQ